MQGHVSVLFSRAAESPGAALFIEETVLSAPQSRVGHALRAHLVCGSVSGLPGACVIWLCKV